MGAIHVAADALSKFCDRFPENVEAATMLAMLQERQGLLQSAVNHLRRALDSLRGRQNYLLHLASFCTIYLSVHSA